MPGLFGLLNTGTRALITGRQGVEVAGQNLANINNPAYARQRLSIVTSPTVHGVLGPQGTGAEAVAIVRLRSDVLDLQIQDEISVTGSLEAQQSALQLAESGLGQELDRVGTGTEAGAAASSVGSSHSLADDLSDLFGGFQSWSTDPASLAERQSVLMKAADLTTHFNQIDRRLDQLNDSLNATVSEDVASANTLLSQIAQLNDQISRTELGAPGSANDLRDMRQSQIEQLSKLAKVDLSDGGNGTVNVSIAGTLMVSGVQVSDTLETYDAGGGQLMVQASSSATPLSLTAGRIQGTMEARDGAVADLRNQVNSLANLLITEVNAIHSGGYGLSGSTGANFFTGTDAGDIAVNTALVNDPSLLQGASAPGASGNNRVALALAQLSQKSHASLNNQTFTQGYSGVATAFGQAMSAVDSQIADQGVVQSMLLRQRDSISGVSLDEEMTDLTRFQRAFQASARLLTVVDDMLQTVVDLKR
ncbi:MAG: flagellar hook-associated protein FlgK [Verrucomicrobiota bacterium]